MMELIDGYFKQGSLLTFTPKGIFATTHGPSFYIHEFDGIKPIKTIMLTKWPWPEGYTPAPLQFQSGRRFDIYPGVPFMFLDYIPNIDVPAGWNGKYEAIRGVVEDVDVTVLFKIVRHDFPYLISLERHVKEEKWRTKKYR